MFKYIKQLTSLVAMVAVLFTFTTESMAAKKSKTLKNTQKKGFVRCGVSQGLPGFSNADAAGNWTGIDVDVCRAVAAAVQHTKKIATCPESPPVHYLWHLFA